MNICVDTINIRGKSELLVANHQSTRTAFRKTPIDPGTIFLTPTGFTGDTVSHTKHHGGNDKAICCYHSAHFPYWKNELGFDLEPGAFGENLTLSGDPGLETNVFIGSRYRLGEAVVEVSEPRGPCYIIGIRYNYIPFPILIRETGFSGFYLRTIQPGPVNTGDSLIQLSSHPEKITVQDVNRIRYQEPANKEWLERLITLEPLTGEWREKFSVLRKKAG